MAVVNIPAGTADATGVAYAGNNLNAWFAAQGDGTAGDVKVIRPPVGVTNARYKIGLPLIIADKNYWRLEPNPGGSFSIDFSIPTGGRRVTGCTVQQGVNTVTGIAGTFVAGDVGKAISGHGLVSGAYSFKITAVAGNGASCTIARYLGSGTPWTGGTNLTLLIAPVFSAGPLISVQRGTFVQLDKILGIGAVPPGEAGELNGNSLEFNSFVEFRGTQGLCEVKRCNIDSIGGDFALLLEEGGQCEQVWIHDNVMGSIVVNYSGTNYGVLSRAKVSRSFFGVICGIDVIIEDNQGCWAARTGADIEPTNSSAHMQNIHILRNTFLNTGLTNIAFARQNRVTNLVIEGNEQSGDTLYPLAYWVGPSGGNRVDGLRNNLIIRNNEYTGPRRGRVLAFDIRGWTNVIVEDNTLPAGTVNVMTRMQCCANYRVVNNLSANVLLQEPVCAPWGPAFVPFTIDEPTIPGRGDAPDVPPLTPTGLTATASAGQIALDWADAADANEWRVFRRNVDLTWPTSATATRTVTNWTDTSVPDGTLRFYRVYAYHTTTGLISSFASAQAQTPAVAPNPPVNVEAFADSASITVSWNPRPAVEDVVEYNVYRSANGTTGWTVVQTVDDVTLSWTDQPLTAGVRLYYRVTAVDDDADESVPSAVVDAMPSGTIPPSYYVPLAEVGTARVGGPDRIGGLGRDREFAASDTLTYGITDAKTGLVSTSARTDMLTVGIAETKATLVLLSRTDTLTVGVTDVKTGLVATSTRTDTVTVGVTDAKLTLASTSARADTLTGGITDAATIASTSALTDTLTVGVSDQSSVAFDVELLVASDTLTVGITDAATDVIVGLDATDTPTVGITDAVSTLAASSDVVDELTVGADEATVQIDGTMATTDTLTIAVDDQTVAGDAVLLDVTDTLSLSIDESSMLETQGGPNDDLILEVVEAASIIATVVTGDTFLVSAGDMVLARSLVSDPLPDETVDLILA